jgi:hypothetical protein
MQSGSRSNSVYNTLLHDYIKYHAVLVIEGGIFALLLIVLGVYFGDGLREREKLKLAIGHLRKKRIFVLG